MLLCTIVTCFHLSSSSHTDASPLAQPSLKVLPHKPQLSCTWPLSQQLITWFLFTCLKQQWILKISPNQISHVNQQYYNSLWSTAHTSNILCVELHLNYTYIVLNSYKNTWIFKWHYLSQCFLFLTVLNYNYASCLKLLTPVPSKMVLNLLNNSIEI